MYDDSEESMLRLADREAVAGGNRKHREKFSAKTLHRQLCGGAILPDQGLICERALVGPTAAQPTTRILTFLKIHT